MKYKWAGCFLLLIVVSNALALDILETRKGVKYRGKIVKVQDTKGGKAFVMKTEQGSTIAVFQKNIARIYRDNQVIDLITGERYYTEVRRPFLPFAVLSIASGAYAINRFQEYDRLHKKAEKERKEAQVDPETINTKDQKNAMAAGIVSSILSVGSLYIAIRPMEIKVPIGKVKVSSTLNGVNIALHF
ncbi:hypothetical protein JW835_16150 [bacterium]|nr:hypothetical protein [bacterium]